MPQGLLARFREIFDGDPGVRKVADDPVLSAELLLLFRMILADGIVDDREMEVFRRICDEAFGIGPESIEAVIEYLNEYGYETTGGQAIALFRDLPGERRVLLARHLAEIARADRAFAEREIKLLRRILDLLDVDPKLVVRAG